jgi:hypothetical protein
MAYDKYFSKNSGAVCYLVCQNLLALDTDIEVTVNNEGFVVLSFTPTNERMDAFRYYVSAFKERKELLVDIVGYNSTFSAIKQKIINYKIINGLK